MADTAYREGDTEQRILRKILERVNQITSGGGGGGGTSPGGTNGQIQFNNAGAFGGLNSTGSGSVVRATSPTLAGTPLAPTATGGTNTTQIATTAFVQSALAGIVQVLHGEVANFAALPTASAHNGENYLVRQSQGVYFVNRKPGGIYTSNGSAWLLDGDATEAYFQDTLAWTNITSKPSTFAPSAHAASHTDGTDDIQDATASVKGLATVAQITKLNGISAGADVTGATIHAATAKTTPVDNDEFGLIDSAALNVLKKLTWANLKATLKTYFDTLYALAEAAAPAPVVTDTTTARTLALTDAGKWIRFTNASDIEVTFPPHSSVAWLADSEFFLEQAGAGQITVVPGSGVTINTSTTLKSYGQSAVIALKIVDTDVATCTGERALT